MPDGSSAMDSALQRRLIEQIQTAEEILSDKDKTISDLEKKLLMQSNQRERAEIRCGTAIKEMEAMKADMVALVQELRASEERCVPLPLVLVLALD
jgi:sialic acid synthase SpsE